MKRTAMLRCALACVAVAGLALTADGAPVKFVVSGQWAEASAALGTAAGDPFTVEFGFDAADFVVSDVHPYGGFVHYYSRGIEGPDLVVDPPTDAAFPDIDNQGWTKFLSIDLKDDGSVIIPRNWARITTAMGRLRARPAHRSAWS